MQRKRWMGTLAILAVFALVGAACGEDTPGPGPGDGGPTTSPSTELPAFETLTEGVLKVASCLDYPPFESVKNGDQIGFDVDLTEEIANRLGLTVEWVKANFDTIFTSVAAGQFDMVAAAVTATGATGEERDQVVDFSDYYFNSQQSLTINTDQSPDIASTDDLGSGDTVGVQKGTTGAVWAKENLEPQGVEIKTFQEAPAAFTDLEAGSVTGVINDEQSTLGIIAERPSLKLVQRIDTNEKYAFAFSPDNPDLIAAVDVALVEIIDDGTYKALFEQYFPGFEVPEEFQPAA